LDWGLQYLEERLFEGCQGMSSTGGDRSLRFLALSRAGIPLIPYISYGVSFVSLETFTNASDHKAAMIELLATRDKM